MPRPPERPHRPDRQSRRHPLQPPRHRRDDRQLPPRPVRRPDQQPQEPDRQPTEPPEGISKREFILRVIIFLGGGGLAVLWKEFQHRLDQYERQRRTPLTVRYSDDLVLTITADIAHLSGSITLEGGHNPEEVERVVIYLANKTGDFVYSGMADYDAESQVYPLSIDHPAAAFTNRKTTHLRVALLDRDKQRFTLHEDIRPVGIRWL